MQVHRIATAAAIVCAAHGACAAGTVEVTYIKPEKFTDIGFGSVDRDRTLKILTDYFQTLGKALPDGQVLKLDVLDVDLAGILRPNARAGEDIRVLRGGADWPRMTLHYTLSTGGTTLKAGDATLSDMNYQTSAAGAQWNQGELAYEKHMVQRWFKQTFGPQ